MKIICVTSLAIMLVLILTGCIDNQYEIRVTGVEGMDATRIENEEEQERWKAWTLSRSRARGKNDLGYIIRENFVPAAYDIDLQTIERFIFFHGGGFHRGVGIVIDRMHGMVYYFPTSTSVQWLNSIPYYAEFIDDDLSRLIQTIEESDLRDWPEVYRGEPSPGAFGGGDSWFVGILFADGSIMRRRGSGRINIPPGNEDGFAILTNFVRTLGAEIIERHDLDE